MKNILSIIIALMFVVPAFGQYQYNTSINENQSKTRQYIGIALGGKQLFSNAKLPASKWDYKGKFSSVSLTDFADALSVYLDVASAVNVSQEISDSLATVTAGDTLPYYEYSALLTQSSTNDPTVTVLYNTFSGTIVWSRNGAGDYRGTLTGAFPANKLIPITTFYSDAGTSNSGILSARRVDDNTVRTIGFDLEAGAFADGSMSNTAIIIRVDK